MSYCTYCLPIGCDAAIGSSRLPGREDTGHIRPTRHPHDRSWLLLLDGIRLYKEPLIERLLFLLRPRERLRSIVMSMSVCVSVCLSARISPEPHARSLPNFCACCLCPWLGLLRHVDVRPHRLSAGRG